jgi:hypothetical protein
MVRPETFELLQRTACLDTKFQREERDMVAIPSKRKMHWSRVPLATVAPAEKLLSQSCREKCPIPRRAPELL